MDKTTMKIRKNDLVVVISGNSADLTKAKRFLRTMPSKGKLVVEGVNKVYKHVRPNRRNMQGGRLSKEMPIDASNVMLYCGACKSGVRTGREFLADGTKVLFCKKCKKAGRSGMIRVLAKAAAPKAEAKKEEGKKADAKKEEPKKDDGKKADAKKEEPKKDDGKKK